MSTANAGIILLLRYCTTGIKVKHMITPLQASQVTSIYHCSLSTGEIMIQDQFNSSIISPFADLQ
jgi:hypothetical protein